MKMATEGRTLIDHDVFRRVRVWHHPASPVAYHTVRAARSG